MAEPAHTTPSPEDRAAAKESASGGGDAVAIDAAAVTLTADHFRPPAVHAWQQQAAGMVEEPEPSDGIRRWPLGWSIVFVAAVSGAMWAGIFAIAWLTF